MPSYQQSVGGGKAAKFVAANPLGPMADPFAGMGDESNEYQKELSENINKRLVKAMDELKEKHANGTNEVDDPDRAPTGAAYHAANAAKAKAEKEKRLEMERVRLLQMKEDANTLFRDKGKDDHHDGDDNHSSSDDDEDEYDKWLDDDPELESIRQRRIQQLKEKQIKEAEYKALGHGQYRTITQDEFLPECTGKSEYVAVHFFHNGFERCKIMDHHLSLIAPLHINCKFLRIDVEKSPFFVSKLQIKTLPTLIVFREGKAVDRLTGFDGLAIDKSEPDKWHTGRLQQWIATTGAIEYTVPTEEVKEEMERLGVRPKGSIWSGTRRGGYRGEAYEDEDE